MFIKVFVLLICAFVFMMPFDAQAGDVGAWSVSEYHPVILSYDHRQSAKRAVSSHKDGMTSAPFKGILRFYQKFISPYDGNRCPMYPTCSQYSMNAINKHGPIIGIIMTADRLIHEANEMDYAPLVQIGESTRFYDPVSNNDFWWYRK